MAARSRPGGRWTPARRSASSSRARPLTARHRRTRRPRTEKDMLKPILLVEDDKRDLELTLVALERSQLANDVVVMRDGAQALEYLLRQGEHAGREEGNPAVILL